MRFITADRIFDGKTFLDDAILVWDNHSFKEVVSASKIESGEIEKLAGILCPGFINAHCHTELSHLKGQIREGTGLPAFGKEILIKRNALQKEEISDKIKAADDEMLKNGIVAVGDISNGTDSFEMKMNSRIYYHTFIELIGLKPQQANAVFESGLNLINEAEKAGLAASLAPHAPYSSSAALIRLISERNEQLNFPSSIHNQESEEETKFFMGKKNQFQDLYDFLKLDISWFQPPQTSSLAYYADSIKHAKTLLVHNTFTGREDVDIVKNKNVFWCFCPGANLYIENHLPDHSLFKNEKHRICIGTDSLASNHQLDMISEANVFLKNGAFSVAEILRFITFGGAQALGIENSFGRWIKGKNAGLNLVSEEAGRLKLIKRII